MQLRILTGEEVRSAIDMKQAIAAMREAFGQLSAGRARVPVRLRLATGAWPRIHSNRGHWWASASH